MSLFVRVNCNFFTHRKTLRLRAALGEAAFWVPPRLWAYAAQNQPDGDFSGYSAEEIASAIDYRADAPSMLQALLKAGFLDADMKIHDWFEHNGYHKAFAERARTAAKARWDKQKERTKEKEEGKREERRGEETSIATSMLVACPSPAGDSSNAEKPKKFVREINDQIKLARARMQKLKDKFSNDGIWHNAEKAKEFNCLLKKTRKWEDQMLESDQP